MEEKGVWRTISGRRVFIKEGQDLKSAMDESGKFNNTKETTETTETKTESFSTLTNLRQQDNMVAVNFDKTMTISDKQHLPATYNLSRGLEKLKQIDEGVAEVDKAFLSKREKQIKDLGYKIISRSEYNEDDPPYQKILFHFSK